MAPCKLSAAKFGAFSLLLLTAILAATVDCANERPSLFRLSRPNFTSTTSTSTTTSTTSTSTTTTPRPAQPAPLSQSLHNAGQPERENRVRPAQDATGAGRSARTVADIFKDGDGYNIFVTNTCELESMRVNVRTSRPFYGVIHTKNERKKPICAVEGHGESEYNLDISHILNPSDEKYCGAIRGKRNSPEDKDIVSVVVAVRLHRDIELSDDKFFLLNCTK